MSKPSDMTAPPAAPVYKHRSIGDRVFDWSVYGGLAGAVTFGLTVVVADELQFGRFKGVYKWLTAIFGRVERVSPIPLGENFAKDAAKTTTLMQGGNAMTLAVAAAEHYKVPIVEAINRKTGDPTPTEQIEEAPKQTLWSLGQARLAAWFVVLASMIGTSKIFPKTFDTFTKEFGERFAQVMRKPTHMLDPATGQHLLDAAGEKIETKTFRYGKLAAIDVSATVAAVVILYVAGHLFAKRHEEKVERKREANVRRDGQPDRDEMDAAEMAALHKDGKDAMREHAAEKPSMRLEGLRHHEGVALASGLVAQDR